MMVRRGAGLIEVTVALVVFSVGWLALLGLYRTAIGIAVDGSVRDEARWALQALADSLGPNGGSDGRVDLPWGWVEWRTEPLGLRLEARDARSDSLLSVLWTRRGGP